MRKDPRIIDGDAEERGLADTLGTHMAADGLLGAFATGKRITSTMAYGELGEKFLIISFDDGSAVRIRGRFSTEIRDRPILPDHPDQLIGAQVSTLVEEGKQLMSGEGVGEEIEGEGHWEETDGAG